MNRPTSQRSRPAGRAAAIAFHPLRFEPILKRLIWGGRRLGTLLGKPIGPESDYAESWEICDHRNDVSRVAEGPLAGTSLRDLLRESGPALLGPALGGSQFPLLVKFLDAQQVLSVQVHPDDILGRRLVQDNGKTESWVVLHADPGSRIYAGLRAGVDRDRFARALADDDLEPVLHAIEPTAGDCLLIPAGTVHAIGGGIVLAEIQQMSDATFRVHDWGRLGPDGRPRPLHLEEALQAIDFTRGPVDPVAPRAEPITHGTRERLARCPYFALERLRLQGAELIGRPDRFTILIGLDGRAIVEHEGLSYPLDRGQTLLMPAAIGACPVGPRTAGESATILTCIVP